MVGNSNEFVANANSRAAQSNNNTIRYWNNEDKKFVTMDGATLEHFDSAASTGKKGNSLGKAIGIGSVGLDMEKVRR
jgi:hypothetical protein